MQPVHQHDMGRACTCAEPHPRMRIVLTGGPGAGKTAVLEMLRQSLCRHVTVLPEAASMLFDDGFPRRADPAVLAAAQRAIFHVQLELETAYEAMGTPVMLCDRGIVDGAAYWPGPSDFWAAVGMSREDALRRYSAVIHLRVPADDNGYSSANPLRIESGRQARDIDERILAGWRGHPQRHIVEPTSDFLEKAAIALRHVRAALPPCCRRSSLP